MSAGSLCLEGKFVPEFYVLGSPKCGTTSLADDLRRAGIRSSVEPMKEAHFFEYKFMKGADFSEIRSKWFAAHGNCTSPEPRHVIADYTPDNTRLVPPPGDWDVNYMPKWVKDHQPGASYDRFNLPLLFTSYLYTGASSRLTFAVMVRETLSRFQSAWYFYYHQLHGPVGAHVDAVGPFSEYVGNAIKDANAGKNEHYVFRLWGGLYGRHLEQWLKYFHPRQFYYIPFLHYLRPGGKKIVFGALAKRLGLSIPVTEQGGASHANGGTHPPLEADLPPNLLAAFRALVAPEVKHFVDLLAKNSKKGLGLANFSGMLGSKADVGAWLEAGW